MACSKEASAASDSQDGGCCPCWDGQAIFIDEHSTFGTTIDEPAISVDGRGLQPGQNKATIAVPRYKSAQKAEKLEISRKNRLLREL